MYVRPPITVAAYHSDQIRTIMQSRVHIFQLAWVRYQAAERLRFNTAIKRIL